MSNPLTLDPASRHILTHILEDEPVEEGTPRRVVRISATALACAMPVIGVAPWVPPNLRFFAPYGVAAQVGSTISTAFGFAAIDALAMYKLCSYYLTPKSQMRRELNVQSDKHYRVLFHVYKVVSLVIAEMTRTPDIASGVLFVSQPELKIALGAIAATTVFLPWKSIDDSIEAIHSTATDSKDVKRLKVIRSAFIDQLGAMQKALEKLDNPELEAAIERLLAQESVKSYLANMPLPDKAESTCTSQTCHRLGQMMGLYACLTLLTINITLSYSLCHDELDFPKSLAAIYSFAVVALTLKFFADGFFAANESFASDISTLLTKRRLPITPASRTYPKTTAVAKTAAMLSGTVTWGASAFFCQEYYGGNPVFKDLMTVSGGISLTTLCMHLLSTFTELTLQSTIKNHGNTDAQRFMQVTEKNQRIIEFVQTISAHSFGFFLLNSAPDDLLSKINTTPTELCELLEEQTPLTNFV